jgi:DNA oxidative demethylase
MTLGLFDHIRPFEARMEPLADGAVVLRGLVGSYEPALRSGLERIVEEAPFRHMLCPSGHRMSVAMSNCGALGWVSDLTGYRYDAIDPESRRPWPAIPDAFLSLAADAAARAGFPAFTPDACLVNRYEPGARLSLHQDKDEHDFRQPIVSVSLGLPATFLFGGARRSDRPRRIALAHGDVVVWGGPARLAFHGVSPLADGEHAVFGRQRINLTFRKAGP